MKQREVSSRVLRRQAVRQLRPLRELRPDLAVRLDGLRAFARKVRSSEYHVTNACNLRCKGCWFFAHSFDRMAKEEPDLDVWRRFVDAEKRRGITAALLIGGEPTLYLDRVELFAAAMPYTTVSTNGVVGMPLAGFEKLAVAITLFGGGPLDDTLRGIRPNGQRIGGLFEMALKNYRNDPRAQFILALTAGAEAHLMSTVQRVADNGNRISFNFYSNYDQASGAGPAADVHPLREVALAARERFPGVVVSHPYFVETILTGKSHFGHFGYEVCPSISYDHPDHKERLRNGHPVLPRFNSFAADARTVNFCCTSGDCSKCRDSQAVYSWLLTSFPYFLESVGRFETWIELAEAYWSQFVWSPFAGLKASSDG